MSGAFTSAPTPDGAARVALWQIDEVLEKKPEKDDHALAGALRNLCLYREGLIAAARGGGEADRQRLGRLNMVLSIVMATEFPSGPVPWEALADARDALAGLAGNATSRRAPPSEG